MSALAGHSSAPSVRQRALGAVVPVASLATLLGVWSVWRLADDVTQSVDARQVAARFLVHVLVGIIPMVLLLVIAIRPPRRLLPRTGYAPLVIGTAVLAVAWVPLAMFVTFYLGT